MASTGISGLAVAFATAGGLLVYAGFKNMSPVAALKSVSGGKPEGVSTTGISLNNATPSSAGPLGVSPNDGGTVTIGSNNVLAAAQKYRNDQYSQARRTQTGWSDCSSFSDKVLRDIGIPPPVKWASTANFRISPEWKNIPLSQARPGDIAINSHHMVMVTGNGGSSAIGQQNTRVDVRTGSVRDLMGSDFVVKRYVGKRAQKVVTV